MSSEQGIYDSGDIDRALGLLAQRGLTFEAEGALWLRNHAVRRRQGPGSPQGDGTYTYLVPDIAYHIDKHEAGLRPRHRRLGCRSPRLYPRMRAVLEALGYPSEFFDVALVQLVKVERAGEEVKMSKRSGQFVTLRDLYEEVGVDAARYFFLRTKGETPMVFDIDIALKQTARNPIFYVQMAHARFEWNLPHRKSRGGIGRGRFSISRPFQRRSTPSCSRSSRSFPRSSKRRRASAGRIGSPATSTSSRRWSTPGITTLGDRRAGGAATEHARLLLARAARITLANALTLLGISAPTGCDLMSLLVVGSIALDSIFTPFGETADALGGSAVYFSVAGSILHPVQVVG